MGYDPHAVIAEGEVLRSAARGLPAARLASIGQGLSLMPMTDVLLDSVVQALRRLGVVAGVGEDEFTAVGLDRHRHSEAWIA